MKAEIIVYRGSFTLKVFPEDILEYSKLIYLTLNHKKEEPVSFYVNLPLTSEISSSLNITFDLVASQNQIWMIEKK